MTKTKAITLSSTPTCNDYDTYAITIEGGVNSVWDDIEKAQDEVERLDTLGNRSVILVRLKKNTKYASPIEECGTVVMVSPGVYRDSDGNVYESNDLGGVGVTRTINNV